MGRPFSPTRTAGAYSGRACEEADHALAELGEAPGHRGVADGDGAEGDEAGHRPHPHRHARAVGATDAVVVEAVLLVPQAVLVDRLADHREVLEELHRDVLVGGVLGGQDDRDLEHGQAVDGHPAGAVGLLEHEAVGQRRGAVEGADVVHAEEAAPEEEVALRVLDVRPPGEAEQQLVEDAPEPLVVAGAVQPEHGEGRQRVDRRVDVTEVPLVRRQLAVGVHEPLARHEPQLLLGELGVDVRERDAVEGQVPRRVPGVLPLVRHRDHVAVVDVAPRRVAALQALGRRRRLTGIPAQPAVDVVVVELLAPEHPAERLPHDVVLLRRRGRSQRGVERVGLGGPVAQRRLPALAHAAARRAQPQPHLGRLPGVDVAAGTRGPPSSRCGRDRRSARRSRRGR